MTVIGKILTVLVLCMSLVFLGFALLINQTNKDTKTGKSWKTVSDELLANKRLMEKDLEQKDVDITRLRAEINKLTSDLKVTKETTDKIVDQERVARAAAETAATQAKEAFMNSQLAVKAAQDELDKRRQEAVALHGIIKQRDITIADMQAKQTIATNEKIQAQVAADTFQKRALGLEKQVTDLTKALEQERIAAGEKSIQSPARSIIDRPPPENVKGIVKAVNGDLVSISIGSDAGLLRGHTLEVYRLSDTKPLYFGKIQIVQVDAHEAVGKLLSPKFAKQVQPNDEVASRILPSVPK